MHAAVASCSSTMGVQPVDQTPGHYDPVDDEDHSAPSARSRLPERAERIKPSARLGQRHMKLRIGLRAQRPVCWKGADGITTRQDEQSARSS